MLFRSLPLPLLPPLPPSPSRRRRRRRQQQQRRRQMRTYPAAAAAATAASPQPVLAAAAAAVVAAAAVGVAAAAVAWSQRRLGLTEGALATYACVVDDRAGAGCSRPPCQIIFVPFTELAAVSVSLKASA